jgi:phosphoribosylformimino-5-aminoimidazole carboxamide ribotide isomerase
MTDRVELYPAIDLRGGRAVRLVRGDYDAEKVYDDDPVAVAAGFAADGVRWLHVVDLDAARTGEPVNRPIIASIADKVAPHGVRIQAGGGVRSEEAAEALEDPPLVRRIASRQPVAVGLDGRHGTAALHGWVDESAVSVLDALPNFEDAGVEAAILTEITRDGTLEGPDIDGLRAALASTTLPIIASGGVGSVDDLATLASLEYDGRHLAGIIVGTALYEGRFGVAMAMSALGSV